ncbi:O-antigen ligase family protein [uncultured Dokdonia sp.]|uniref:O-antigen ligase family protein n=1 Tax=uncultured Dokdonia sp. TaxID=575653 RepID=UPI00261859EB|nr:O-antigen ligase family protein [uncultured Dokdonia sp.]
MERIKGLFEFRALHTTLCILFALVIVPSNLKAVVIFLSALTILVVKIKNGFSIRKSFLLLNSSVYLLIVITLFYTTNFDYGIKKLSTMLSLGVFPILFSLFQKEEIIQVRKKYKYYLWIYIITVLLFNCISFLWFYFSNPNYDFPGIIEHFETIVRVDMGKFNIHPIYLSMHCAIAILFSFKILSTLVSKKAILLLLSIDIVLLSFILLYAKKGPIIALLLVFSLFLMFQRNKKHTKTHIIVVLCLVGVTVAIPKTRERFVELLKIENIQTGPITSTNIRYTIYDIAQDLIKKSPVIGYGIGDYNDTLIKQYKSDGEAILAIRKYNSHNQFFSLLLIGGIPLLIVFLLMIGVNLIYAIRYDNQLLILLLIFYCIVMFTENILERESGVIFFSFFINFFALFNNGLLENENSPNTQ